MLTIFSVSVCLFLMILIGWTFTTYLIKKESQKKISEEIMNLFSIFKKFFLSIQNLIKILVNNSISYEGSKGNPIDDNILNEREKPLSVVQKAQEIESPSLEIDDEGDNDTALAAFSPEVVEVINEEEEKVA